MKFIAIAQHSPKNFDFFCANKMIPGISEDLLRAEHEFGNQKLSITSGFQEKGG